MSFSRVVLLAVCVALLAAVVLGEVATQRSSVCQAHVSCISKVLRASHICGGEMLCKQMCEDLNVVIDAALDTTYFWEKNCGEYTDSARFVLQSATPALVTALAAASGCGEQACEARLRFGQMNAVCERDVEFDELLATTLCNSQLQLAIDDARLHQARHVVKYTPEGSIGTQQSPSPTNTVITAGREAGDIIGFIILCALIIACVIPMSILFLRWLFMTIKNFDGQAFMARFGK